MELRRMEKQNEINNRLREKGIDICIITETKLNKNDIVKVRGFDIINKNR